MLHQDEADDDDDIAWFACKNNFIEIKKIYPEIFGIFF